MVALRKWMAQTLGRVVEGEQGAGAAANVDGSERRQFARVQVDLVVSLVFDSLDAIIHCRTLDLSRGGAFIATNRPRPKGTSVRLKLHVGARKLNLRGEIVRVVSPQAVGQTPGIAIEFRDVDPGTRAQIAALVDLRSR